MQAANAKTVLISGGTGLVGTALTRYLAAKGYRIIILTRNPAVQQPPAGTAGRVSYAAWDVDAGTIDEAAVANADMLVHLAGAGVVAKPWTESYKKEIRDSRVHSSQLLTDAIKSAGSKLTTVISASAIGWYGADKPGGKPFVESDAAATGFLGDTCRDWEASIQPVQDAGKRLAIFRFGIVLSNDGGALPEFKKPLAFRIAGILGNGQQIVSWIHMHDLCRMIRYALEHTHVAGVYNAVAPAAVSNRQLNQVLATCMYGKNFISLPVPGFVLKIMMGERSIEVLKSTHVSAQKIMDAGFVFDYPIIEKALAQLTAP